jgi:hypothetical protein
MSHVKAVRRWIETDVSGDHFLFEHRRQFKGAAAPFDTAPFLKNGKGVFRHFTFLPALLKMY